MATNVVAVAAVAEVVETQEAVVVAEPSIDTALAFRKETLFCLLNILSNFFL